MAGIQYRQRVQNAVVAALAAEFNATFAAIAADPEYGGLVTPASLDFSSASRDFVQVAIRKEDIEHSPLFDLSPCALALCTGNADDTGRVRGLSFDGSVDAHLIGIMTGQSGAETANTEVLINAFEDAAWTTLNDYNAWPIVSGISLKRVTRGNRGDLAPLSGGYRQWFEIIAGFLVQIP